MWGQFFELRRHEKRRDPLLLGIRKFEHAGRFDLDEFLLDAPPHLFDPDLVHEDFYARLPEIVAPAGLVVDAKHRFKKSKNVALRYEVARLEREVGRAAQTAAHENPISDFATI